MRSDRSRMAEFMLGLVVDATLTVILVLAELGMLDTLNRSPGFWALEPAADAYGLIGLAALLTLWAGLARGFFGRRLAAWLFDLVATAEGRRGT